MTWITLQVRALRLESEDVLGVELAPPSAAPLPFDWAPGAHVDLRLGNGVVRQYSVISRPEEGHLYLGIKRENASRGGSRWLHEHLRLGAQLQVGEPRNLFALQPGTGPVILVAAGIGITPLLPMYRQCQAQGRPVRLLYFTRDARQAPFLQRLDEHIELHAGLRARQIAAHLARQLPAWAAEASLYCCGPAGFMDCVERTALACGWPHSALHREHFQATAPTTQSNSNCSLVLQRSGVEVQVQPGESLVQAAARGGVALPVSCGMGICGACISRVIEGEPEHRDECLSDAQRSSGAWVAPCVSGCGSLRLVLDA
ncbi:Pdr/VanB family oxidoreductase [Pseudomonas putida]|uniref:Pdr/VanB family oxidoreductase n=1 Tax=Pseudomonas putida TaxID=303 RepID=A0A2S3X5P6_PSEPU|nr:PDR/VanB family oxidoreductase [Pseudomonas putida]POG10910.1 Pdr/VanB family oxidoreductase [Pseudomonas putida]POG15181.1 Pdr/VanB family oxidoreductase [Pseudomonas putida]